MALAALGERLYRQGVGVSGAAVSVFDRAGQPVLGPGGRCVSCHRASGYGSNEGAVYAPPITGPILFSPRTLQRSRYLPGMFQQVQPPEFTSQLNAARERPAYDAASLARVLRQGRDANGAQIAAAMPRYRLSDRDVAALAAYLKTLSAHSDPGVDDKTIRFAVIVTDRTPPAVRQAVVDTSKAFVTQVNRGLSAEASRPNFSPYYRSDLKPFWRAWALDVWELQAPESGWPRQLADHYAAAPVFAVASAAVPGAWAPIGGFCDAHRLPCLFPLTDLPAAPAATGPGYSVYASGGLPLEARAMAAYLAYAALPPVIVQVAAPGARGSVPAGILRAELGRRMRSVRVETVPAPSEGPWTEAVARAAQLAGPTGALVLWPGEAPERAVDALAAVKPGSARVLLASAAEPAAIAGLTGDLAARVRIMHPTDLPGAYHPLSFRIRQWLDARRVALTPPDDQYRVYYSLSVLEKALMEIQGSYSRDYLLEHIETVAESNLNPGVYPNLSLGPGQRVASRGSYVVRLDRAAPGGVRPDGDWIVP